MSIALATEQIARRDFKGALATLESHITTNPNDAEGWYLIAYLNISAEYPDAALQFITRALALRPDAPPFYTLMGDAFTMQGNGSQALQAYAKAFRLLPDDSSLFTRLLFAALHNGTPDVAAQIESSIGHYPVTHTFAAAVADAYASVGRFDMAIEWFNRARAAATDYISALRYGIESALLQNDDSAIPALLARYPTALAAVGQRFWAEAHETFSAPAANLTCVVTTNLTKKLVMNKHKAPPKLDLIAETLASWRAALQPAATTRVLIYFDQPKTPDDDATLYAERLAGYAAEYGYEVVLKNGNGLKNNVLDALQQTDTDFFTLLEHDFLFTDCPPQITLMDTIAANPFMHIIQFNRRPNVALRWDTHLWPEPRVAATPLLRTPRFSNNPYVGRTAKIRTHFVPLFSGANAFDGINGGAGGLEEQVKETMNGMMQNFGFGFTQRWSGYYLYGRMYDAPRLTHTGI
jgi:tetratricopeptide (TPR) repeat protein